LVLSSHNTDTIKQLQDNIEEINLTNFTTKRNELLKANIMELIKIIDDVLLNQNHYTKIELAYLYFTKSICLDKLPDYSKAAEESASKLVG
jgi:hypothetical protein